jgi:hypothetical protein
MLLKLFRRYQAARRNRAKLQKAVTRLARQLDWRLDTNLNSEQQTIDLLNQISSQMDVSKFAPKPALLPQQMANNLRCLDLCKHPLKQPSLPAPKPPMMVTSFSNKSKTFDNTIN